MEHEEEKQENWKVAREIKEEFKVSIATVHNWRKDGCPHDIRFIGRKEFYLFRSSDVAEWLEKTRKNKLRNTQGKT